MATFTFAQAAGYVVGRAADPAAARAARRPVLRGSTEAGTFEDGFFATPAKGETDRLLAMARACLDAGRKARRQARIEDRALTAAEELAASLTAGAVRVFEELVTLARLHAGRVYPSYDRLAAVTGLGRATVARAIAILERAGFLVRRRRFVRVEGEGAGPRYAQMSNVYRATLPARLLALLPRRLRPAPVPDDELQRQAERDGATQAMRASLSCGDLARATAEGPLGRMLMQLGIAIDRRESESHRDPQILSESLVGSSVNDAEPQGEPEKGRTTPADTQFLKPLQYRRANTEASQGTGALQGT